jgi:hypothetical protein
MSEEPTYDGPRIGDLVEVLRDAAGRSGTVTELAGQHGEPGAWVAIVEGNVIWFSLDYLAVLERRP